MKKIFLITTIALILLGWAYWKDGVDNSPRRPINSNITHRILIKFYSDIRGKEEIIKGYGLKRIGSILKGKWEVARCPDNVNLKEAINKLLNDKRVIWAEPDYIVKIAEETIPNDSLFGQQWYLKNEGTVQGYVKGADVKATYGWDFTTGSENVIIGVVDTGVDYNHPDLENKVIKGYDFVNSDSDPMDDNGHGTMVAGIIGADSNNEEGIAGVCWKCKILAVKAIDSQGTGYYSWISDGIEYAVDQGANVINISAGGNSPGVVLEEALDYAISRNSLVVAAAGNSGGQLLYPAGYSPKCISVGATDYADKRASFSNYGPNLDIMAPGVDIVSTLNGGAYAVGSGTSFSAPIVSGAAGLLISLKPGLNVEQLRKTLIYTSDDVNSQSLPGFDYYMGYGRLNLQTVFSPIHLE